MNQRRIKRVTGLLLVVIAVFGIFLALIGLIETWQLRASFTERVTQGLDLTQSTLETTRQGLDIMHTSLDNTAASLNTLQLSTIALGQTISDTVKLLDNTSTIIGEDLPQTLYAVQNSLLTAQQAAKVVDNVLDALSRIPFVSGLSYNPETPLNESIAGISANLNDMPASLTSIGDQLKVSGDNVSGMQPKLEDLSLQIGAIQENLTSMKGVVEEYQNSLDQAVQLAQNLQNDIPKWINSAALIISVILIWFGFAQLGPLLQGWQIYQNNREQESN